MNSSAPSPCGLRLLSYLAIGFRIDPLMNKKPGLSTALSTHTLIMSGQWTTALFTLLSRRAKAQYKADVCVALQSLINNRKTELEEYLGKPVRGTVLVYVSSMSIDFFFTTSLYLNAAPTSTLPSPTINPIIQLIVIPTTTSLRAHFMCIRT